jgi:hypothetical protein
MFQDGREKMRFVFCNVCVHPMSDCCRFLGDQLSCIDCYRTRQKYTVTHVVPYRASKDLKAPLDPNNQARKEDVSKHLEEPPAPNNLSRKKDERKPSAVNKEVDDAISKLKDPPKPVQEVDEDDDRKPPAKENKADKDKRQHPKLPLHLNSTDQLPNSLGKSPHMDLDLEDTDTDLADNVKEDKTKAWKLLTTLKVQEARNLK